MSISLRIHGEANTAALDAMIRKLPRDMQYALDRSARRALDNAIRSAPVGKHFDVNGRPVSPQGKRFKEGLRLRKSGSLAWYLDATAPHSRYVLLPTKAHAISAREGRLLHFWWAAKRRSIHARTVNHPGTPGNPVLARAVAAERVRFAETMASTFRSRLSVNGGR